MELYRARVESMMRLKDAWEQLAQRYACPLDEDYIIDLREERNLKHRYLDQLSRTPILVDEPGNYASSEAGDEDDFDGLDSISLQAHVPESLGARLGRVKPLRDVDSDDERDLHNFLDAERQRREQFGPVDEQLDEHFCEDLAQVQDADDVLNISGSDDDKSDHQPLSESVDDEESDHQPFSPTRTRDDRESDDEDELERWVYDESTAIYKVATIRHTIPDQ
jgi:hypothetical protein